MRWLSSVTALGFGALMLVLASRGPGLAASVVEAGLRPVAELGTLELGFTLGLLGLGMIGMSVGLVMGWRLVVDGSGRVEPWRQALIPLAHEYGRVVETDPQEGMGFASQVDGIRTEVVVQPRNGMVSIWVKAPGRQMLMAVPRSRDGAMVEDVEWRLAGERGTWVLRAELPAVARPLLKDRFMVDSMDRLMGLPWAQAVRHDHKGIEVLMDLPPPDELADSVRRGLAVCRVLRSINA